MNQQHTLHEYSVLLTEDEVRAIAQLQRWVWTPDEALVTHFWALVEFRLLSQDEKKECYPLGRLTKQLAATHALPER